MIHKIKFLRSPYAFKLFAIRSQKPIGLHPLAVPDLTDSELIAIISRILLEHGQATIGKLGSLLQSYTDNHNLSQFIKERHGGLKRFCEKNSHIFLIGADHQYNPTVSLHLLQ
jgi:hypothetical protein